MSAFKFRLEKVLSVYQILEEQAKQEWALQEKLAHEERLKLEVLNIQKEEARAFGYAQGDLALRQAMYGYLAVLEQRISRQTSVIAEQEALAAQAKETWIKARQETQKVSTLRENKYEEFLKEELRKEQKILDDMRAHLQE